MADNYITIMLLLVFLRISALHSARIPDYCAMITENNRRTYIGMTATHCLVHINQPSTKNFAVCGRGQLLEIRNHNQQESLNSVLGTRYHGSVWLGLQNVNNQWRWDSDNRQLKWRDLQRPSSFLFISSKKNCAVFSLQNKDWKAVKCDEAHLLICQFDKLPITSTPHTTSELINSSPKSTISSDNQTTTGTSQKSNILSTFTSTPLTIHKSEHISISISSSSSPGVSRKNASTIASSPSSVPTLHVSPISASVTTSSSYPTPIPKSTPTSTQTSSATATSSLTSSSFNTSTASSAFSSVSSLILSSTATPTLLSLFSSSHSTTSKSNPTTTLKSTISSSLSSIRSLTPLLSSASTPLSTIFSILTSKPSALLESTSATKAKITNTTNHALSSAPSKNSTSSSKSSATSSSTSTLLSTIPSLSTSISVSNNASFPTTPPSSSSTSKIRNSTFEKTNTITSKPPLTASSLLSTRTQIWTQKLNSISDGTTKTGGLTSASTRSETKSDIQYVTTETGIKRTTHIHKVHYQSPQNNSDGIEDRTTRLTRIITTPIPTQQGHVIDMPSQRSSSTPVTSHTKQPAATLMTQTIHNSYPTALFSNNRKTFFKSPSTLTTSPSYNDALTDNSIRRQSTSSSFDDDLLSSDRGIMTSTTQVYVSDDLKHKGLTTKKDITALERSSVSNTNGSGSNLKLIIPMAAGWGGVLGIILGLIAVYVYRRRRRRRLPSVQRSIYLTSTAVENKLYGVIQKDVPSTTNV